MSGMGKVQPALEITTGAKNSRALAQVSRDIAAAIQAAEEKKP